MVFAINRRVELFTRCVVIKLLSKPCSCPTTMFFTNSLQKGAPYTLARHFLVTSATRIRPPNFTPLSRVSYLGVRSFIVDPTQQGAQNDKGQPREEQQPRQEIPKDHFREASFESRGISQYLTGLLVVGFGLTAYGL